MNKYLVVYHAPASWEQRPDVTPDEMKAGMQAWMDWADKAGDRLLDWGARLAGGQRLAKGVPPAAAERGVIGYGLVQADDMDAAVALLQEHPHLDWAPGCEIEVHEYVQMPG